MAVILSGATALQALRRGARLVPLRSDGAPLATPAAAASARDRREELQAAYEALVDTGLLDPGQSMDVMVTSNEHRPAMQEVKVHRWTSKARLPVRELQVSTLPGPVRGLYVVSPELLFVQMCAAEKLPRKGAAPSPRSMAHVRAVLLGWELCGRYGKVLPGDRRADLVERGFENRPPLTTAKKLADFIDGLPEGLAGVRRARHALKLVRDRGRSPMEAAVFVLLAGPVALGGFGLPAPEVNYELELSPRNAQLLGESKVEVDNYWLRPLDLEVDGFRDHGGTPSKRRATRIAVRDNELARRGIPVVHLTGQELMDPERFRLNAKNIADELGVRLRLDVQGWEERYRRLHAEVMNLEYVPLNIYGEGTPT